MNKSLYLQDKSSSTSVSTCPPSDGSKATEIELSSRLSELKVSELDNWLNLISPPVVNWHGQWVKYNADGSLQQSYQSLRAFRTNSCFDEIHQENTYFYQDGTVLHKSFEYTPGTILFMPNHAILTAADKAVLFAAKQVKSTFAAELFLKRDAIRYSVVVMYEERDGRKVVSQIGFIRECAAEQRGKFWSEELAPVPARAVAQASGFETFTAANYDTSEKSAAIFAPGQDERKVMYLPDGVTLHYPEHLPAGGDFVLATVWQSGERLQALDANYKNHELVSIREFDGSTT